MTLTNASRVHVKAISSVRISSVATIVTVPPQTLHCAASPRITQAFVETHLESTGKKPSASLVSGAFLGVTIIHLFQLDFVRIWSWVISQIIQHIFKTVFLIIVISFLMWFVFLSLLPTPLHLFIWSIHCVEIFWGLKSRNLLQTMLLPLIGFWKIDTIWSVRHVMMCAISVVIVCRLLTVVSFQQIVALMLCGTCRWTLSLSVSKHQCYAHWVLHFSQFHLSISLLGETPLCGVFAYSDRSVCRLSSVIRVVYCGQTVQDRPIVCLEVE